MNLVATMPVRNEAWCVGLSLRVALKWCDSVIVFDHASTDRTKEIVHDVMSEVEPGRVIYTHDDNSVWSEMQHRQWMLEAARKIKATHIAIVDADEVLTGNLLASCPKMFNIRAGEILQLPGYNLRGGIHSFHTNGTWGKRWFSIAFQDDPRLHWSSDARAGYDHHHREPMGKRLEPHRSVVQGAGGIMHLWGVSDRRLRAKHTLYKITERLRWPDKNVADIDKMYSLAIHGNPPAEMPHCWQYERIPESWWEPYTELLQYLDISASPWQEVEAKRLYNLYGSKFFKGLDLFGVV